ncbi:MAG TPA: DUF3224 domain-containing protein [Edaphobacter sp.]|jgi:hypothetical protein|nr:DUF3224 domain-containing protein [Edaphobacter sp.]
MNSTRVTITTLALILTLNSAAWSQASKDAPMPQAATQSTTHATGTFDVKLDPQPTDEKAGGETLARLLIAKQFHGDLEATSKGTMLSAGTAVKGSAGYVAMESVTGSLHGHAGTFVLQHSATMNRGVPQLSITVVPDSGTGQLTGLTGKMLITIAEGKHSYTFEYTLAEAP